MPEDTVQKPAPSTPPSAPDLPELKHETQRKEDMILESAAKQET